MVQSIQFKSSFSSCTKWANKLKVCFYSYLSIHFPVTQLFITAWKVSVLGVFLIYILPHLDWICHIQSECGKIQTRKTPSTDTFHAVYFNMEKKPWRHSFSSARFCYNRKYSNNDNKILITVIIFSRYNF